MAAKKRKCKLGRTKAGKCRKTKKSRGLSSLGTSDRLTKSRFFDELEKMEDLQNTQGMTAAHKKNVCNDALNTYEHIVAYGHEPTIRKATGLFKRYCIC